MNFKLINNHDFNDSSLVKEVKSKLHKYRSRRNYNWYTETDQESLGTCVWLAELAILSIRGTKTIKTNSAKLVALARRIYPLHSIRY